jgi:hypothetical protein
MERIAIQTTGNLVGGGSVLLDPEHNVILDEEDCLEDNPSVRGPCALIYLGQFKHIVVPVEAVGSYLANAYDSSRAIKVVKLGDKAVQARHLQLREGGELVSSAPYPRPWATRNG